MSDSLDSVFDALMEKVGYEGAFQKRFHIIFNVALVMVSTISYTGVVFAYAKQDHWCHVPGRELTNLSHEQWKLLTVPSNSDASGIVTFSKCQMFDVDWDTFGRTQTENGTGGEKKVIDCQHGWDYNTEWYKRTVVSQENWVCEKALYQSNIYAFGRLGEVLGALLFGQLGDRIGRRKSFYLCVIVILIGQISAILFVSYYTLLVVASVLGSLGGNSVLQSPLIIAMESSRAENRASIAVTQNATWSLSMCVMSMIYWLTGDWELFSWITTLPLAIFLCFPNYMIESPRWLATSGRLAECAKYLNNIARINGRPTVVITKSYLEKVMPESNQTNHQVYGMWSFFSGWRIARNTMLLILCWCICNLSYFALLLSVAELPGNPFVNFCIQSIVELPAYFVGQYMCDKIGRRFTNALSFALSLVLMCITVCVVKYESLVMVWSALIFATKFSTCIMFMSLNLQALETHPTCLRQTGMSLSSFMANVAGVLGPYIVYLGSNYDAQWPYIILGGLYFVGLCCCLFTVETHLQKLPDSLEEAMHFGENQKFWSLPRAPETEIGLAATMKEVDEEAEQLNPHLYSL